MSQSRPLQRTDEAASGFEGSAKAPVMVRISNLHKSYGRTEVLKGIDLTVHRGEVVTVIGPSGSGKSTLLSCINFLEPFDRGEITIDGQPIGWVTGAGGRTRMGARAQSDAAANRHRVSAIQPVSAFDRAAERD